MKCVLGVDYDGSRVYIGGMPIFQVQFSDGSLFEIAYISGGGNGGYKQSHQKHDD
jgi:hypothetical protein